MLLGTFSLPASDGMCCTARFSLSFTLLMLSLSLAYLFQETEIMENLWARWSRISAGDSR